MPAQTERLLWRFIGGLRAGQKSASGAYTEFSNVGYQTMTGCARVYNEIALGPLDFQALTTACTTGSLYNASLLQDISSSIFGGVAASSAKIYGLNMGAGASPASPLTAFAMFNKPLNADTSGSIAVIVDWTYGDAPATTGSKLTMQVGMGYFGGGATTPCAVRTAGSTGAASVASYSGTTCGLLQSTCVGALPSFSASDTGGVFVLKYGSASAAGDMGKMTAGCVFILGVRLRYMVNKLGLQSTE